MQRWFKNRSGLTQHTNALHSVLSTAPSHPPHSNPSPSPLFNADINPAEYDGANSNEEYHAKTPGPVQLPAEFFGAGDCLYRKYHPNLTESKHIKAVKEPWRQSSRYKALGQMLMTNQCLDKLTASCQDFCACGMLNGTCLSSVLAALNTQAPKEHDNTDQHGPPVLSDAVEDGNEDFEVIDDPMLGNVLGSCSYAVVYHAQNLIKDDLVAVKLEPIINHSSSVASGFHASFGSGENQCIMHWSLTSLGRHYMTSSLRMIEGHCRELTPFFQLSRLEYIHLHDFVHGDIKPQNILVGLDDLKDTAFIIDFGIAKEYCNTSTRAHILFRQGQCTTGTPAFASINSHLGVALGRRNDLKSLMYTLIYFLHSSLPWLTSDHEKLSNSSMLERKVNTTVEVLCHRIPIKFTSLLIYTCSLAFSENPDYEYLRSLLHAISDTLPMPAACLLDFGQPNPIIHTPAFTNKQVVPVDKAVQQHPMKANPPCRSTHM
ncbi:kinase-like domain-containing protein [Suillus subluteus]|nr:kinase-like domain-containing protein [Suillus subluteus]